ncbi:MAG: hypothetical protein V4640_06965 [Verrucomicrobiota bacterium]
MRSLFLILLLALAACTKEKSEFKSTEFITTVQLHPEFPVVEAHYQMTKEWSVDLPTKFNRRFEESDLVIWKPGFTIWTTVWNNKSESPDERLAWIRDDSSPDAFDAVTETSNGLLRYSYRLKEDSDDARLPGFYCYAIGKVGHVQMAIYFDSPDDLDTAQAIWRSLTENPNKRDNKP